ncbi:MAG: hypothetical protein KC609_21215 [Myxococcales bacterium]|nr:hypothetical protein [Myxococcales bacterium]
MVRICTIGGVALLLLTLAACSENDKNIKMTQTLTSTFSTVQPKSPLTVTHEVDLGTFSDFKSIQSKVKCVKLSLANSFLKLASIRFKDAITTEADLPVITVTGFVSASATSDKFQVIKWVFQGSIDVQSFRLIRFNRVDDASADPKQIVHQTIIDSDSKPGVAKLEELLESQNRFFFHVQLESDRELPDVSVEVTFHMYSTTVKSECSDPKI